MAAVFCNAGELEGLSRWFYATAQPEYWIHLYSNAFTPVAGMANDASDFTECDFDGYAPILLENWTLPVSVSGIAVTTADQVSFIAGAGIGSPQDAVGYYVTLDEAGTSLLWAEEFVDGPFTFAAEDDTRAIIASVNLQTLPVP